MAYQLPCVPSTACLADETPADDVTVSQASPAVSRVTSASNDEFPALRQLRGGPSRARSSLGSLASMPDSPSQTPQRPSFHPTFSRLRSISTQSFPSKNRFVSSSTYNTALEYPYDTGNPPRRPPLAGGISASPSTSNLDNISRRSSYTNLFDLPSTSDLPTGTSASNASSAGRANGTSPPARTVKWSSLKRISARVYPQSGATAGAAALSQAEQIAKSAMGQPTVMAVSGLIAIGTTKGWVLVFDFGQNLRCVCGTEGNGALTGLLRVAFADGHARSQRGGSCHGACGLAGPHVRRCRSRERLHPPLLATQAIAAPTVCRCRHPPAGPDRPQGGSPRRLKDLSSRLRRRAAYGYRFVGR